MIDSTNETTYWLKSSFSFGYDFRVVKYDLCVIIFMSTCIIQILGTSVKALFILFQILFLLTLFWERVGTFSFPCESPFMKLCLSLSSLSLIVSNTQTNEQTF